MGFCAKQKISVPEDKINVPKHAAKTRIDV
jgi:hypothetical protein